MSVSAEIVEKKSVPEGLRILCGLPDVGLVGTISVSYITSELKLNEIAYMNSNLLPPTIILEKGLPYSPVRIFGNSDFMMLHSEIAIPTRSLRPVVSSIVDWMEKKHVKSVIILGGLAVPNRQEIQEPKVFGCASDESSLEMLKQQGIEILERGFLVGAQALILKFCAERKIPAIVLLAEAFYNYPDPAAAAMVIKVVNQIIETKIDISKLLEEGEDIRLRMRDMMKRTQTELTRANKSQEFDAPNYYVS